MNTHEHSEQPHLPKGRSAIHTSLRRMASLAHLAIWCGYALVKDGVAFVFNCNCGEKAPRSLPCASSAQVAPLRTQVKTELNAIRSWRLPIAKDFCLWGIQRWRKVFISIRGHLRTAE